MCPDKYLALAYPHFTLVRLMRRMGAGWLVFALELNVRTILERTDISRHGLPS